MRGIVRGLRGPRIVRPESGMRALFSAAGPPRTIAARRPRFAALFFLARAGGVKRSRRRCRQCPGASDCSARGVSGVSGVARQQAATESPCGVCVLLLRIHLFIYLFTYLLIYVNTHTCTCASCMGDLPLNIVHSHIIVPFSDLYKSYMYYIIDV